MFLHPDRPVAENKTTGHFAPTEGRSSFWPATKTTGRLVSVLATVFVLALPPAAAPAEITFTSSNDPVSANDRPDDLYTSELALGVHLDRRDVVFRERMFTDHDRGLRFDETSLELSRPVRRLGGWGGEVGLGVLHVGRGLLGESVQNAVHRLVGSEEEDLRYAADHRLYPLATLSLARPLPLTSNLGTVSGRIDATAAPGFHSSLRVGLVAERSLAAGLDVLVGLAGVVHHVETGLLGDTVASSGVAWDVGVGWRDVFLVLSQNAYGTESRHVTLGYRFSASSGPRAGTGR